MASLSTLELAVHLTKGLSGGENRLSTGALRHRKGGPRSKRTARGDSLDTLVVRKKKAMYVS